MVHGSMKCVIRKGREGSGSAVCVGVLYSGIKLKFFSEITHSYAATFSGMCVCVCVCVCVW